MIDEHVEQVMLSRTKPLPAHEIKPTRLYARNINVDLENAKQFDLLDSEAFEFLASDQAHAAT